MLAQVNMRVTSLRCKGILAKTVLCILFIIIFKYILHFTRQWYSSSYSTRRKPNNLSNKAVTLFRANEDNFINAGNRKRDENAAQKKKMPALNYNHEKQKANNSQTKLILAYTTIYGKRFKLGMNRSPQEVKSIPNPLSKCEYRCKWSTDRSDYNKSDAVVFHLYNLSPEAKGKGHGEFVISKLPTRYRRDQKWVLMIREPNSFFYPQQLKLLDDKFNLSMTFQSDSDVVIPYGRYWKLSPSEREKASTVDYITGKSKMVAWLVSNCITSSRREDYVRELQKYIQVDVYGGCGSLKASVNGSRKFLQILKTQYKFYIAFENSDCDDYVTEKFWDSLSKGMIPIVRGQRVNYQRIAPPNSFVDADIFDSPEQLAKYLKEVSSNVDLLKKYHNWREEYAAEFHMLSADPNWYCNLCEKVHTSPAKTINVYKHFSEDTRCNVFDRVRNRTGEHMQDIER